MEGQVVVMTDDALTRTILFRQRPDQGLDDARLILGRQRQQLYELRSVLFVHGVIVLSTWRLITILYRLDGRRSGRSNTQEI